MWSVELIGGVNDPRFAEGDRSVDFIPQDWTPGENPYDSFDKMSDVNESTGMEGDISAGTSENDSDEMGWVVSRKENKNTLIGLRGQIIGMLHGLGLIFHGLFATVQRVQLLVGTESGNTTS